jgi:lipoprotein-anchoring transpeptidase ErfK/SrfK
MYSARRLYSVAGVLTLVLAVAACTSGSVGLGSGGAGSTGLSAPGIAPASSSPSISTSTSTPGTAASIALQTVATSVDATAPSTSSVLPSTVGSGGPPASPTTVTTGITKNTGTTKPTGITKATGIMKTAGITKTTKTTRSVVLPPVARVTALPAFGSSDISPSQPLIVSVTKGTIRTVTLRNAAGKVVKGAISKDGASWSLGEVLGYGKTYTVSGSAMGTDGLSVPITGTFSTVEPDTRVRVIVSPGDGEVVGVAAPVIVRFGMEPQDRVVVEKHVKVTTTPTVEGAWAWIKHDDGAWAMDWRPKAYWPAKTKVHVEADVYGVDFGGGSYGGDDVTSDFTIGRDQVVYANAKSHHIVVKREGRTVADYPASYGSGDDIGDPNRVTRSGIHVVNELLPVHKMSNPAYHYVNVTEYWDVRISNNGEFIHQNQKTVDQQGTVNVSHGCVNLSAQNAKAYFKSALYGDPVEVTGTSVQLSSADGDLYDWTIPWTKWVSMSAL